MLADHCLGCRLSYVNQCSVQKGFFESGWYLESIRACGYPKARKDSKHEDLSYVSSAPFDVALRAVSSPFCSAKKALFGGWSVRVLRGQANRIGSRSKFWMRAFEVASGATVLAILQRGTVDAFKDHAHRALHSERVPTQRAENLN
jgi:hypothetical protein